MRKALLTGLMVAALALVAPPAVTAAGDGGNSAAAKTCQADSALYGFETRGECVSHVAQGGTLVATFQSTCEAHGGTYGTGGTINGTIVTDRCEWTGISSSAHNTAMYALIAFCPGGTEGFWSPGTDPDTFGCMA